MVRDASSKPIKDLDILFIPKLKSDVYINNTTIRRHKISGFISRIDLLDKYTLKSLYCLNFYVYFLKGAVPKELYFSYAPLLFILNLETFVQRRVYLDLYFRYKLLERNNDCTDILGRLSFSISTRTIPSKNVIYLSLQVTNYTSTILVQ